MDIPQKHITERLPVVMKALKQFITSKPKELEASITVPAWVAAYFVAVVENDASALRNAYRGGQNFMKGRAVSAIENVGLDPDFIKALDVKDPPI